MKVCNKTLIITAAVGLCSFANAIDHAGSFSSGSSFTAANGKDSHAQGFSCLADGDYSYAAGLASHATGESSHAEGYQTLASGKHSHSEGSLTAAYGYAAHAEGYYSVASNFYAHAEGYYTEARAPVSHAQGVYTIASGVISSANGWFCEALGYSSYANGLMARAAHNDTFVWSSSNLSNDYVFSSTTNDQFNVYAENGIRLVTGSNAVIKLDKIDPREVIMSAPGESYDGLTLEEFVLQY